MDLKNNYCSVGQQPTHIKSTHLLTPMLNIGNASTPVRTRIVKPSSQLNSTPVNGNKVVKGRCGTPTNKQNNNWNSKGSLKTFFGQKNSNLSPIMGHNRNNSQNIESQTRSLTPTNLGRKESFSNLNDYGAPIQYKNQQLFAETLKQSRRSSNFQSMIQSRSKTPTRIKMGDSKQSFSTNHFNPLRSSNSTQSLLGGFGKLKQSKSSKLLEVKTSKLSESRSFEQLINLGTPQVRDNDVLCSNSNEHEKKAKAKYKIVDDDEEEDLLIYCSKCAINLVKKGFKVEDLTQEDIQRIKSQQVKQQSYSNQYFEYANETKNKLKLKFNELCQQKHDQMDKFNEEIQDIDCYYNSLISVIEQHRVKDRQYILAIRDKQKKQFDSLEKKLTQAQIQLTQIFNSNYIVQQQFYQIQKFQALLVQKVVKPGNQCKKFIIDDIQSKFDHFSILFQNQIKLLLSDQDRQDYSPNYFVNQSKQKGKTNMGLRFSFEKSLKQDVGLKNMETMNALEQATEELEGEDSGEIVSNKEKQAFRTLFPEEDEQCQEEGAGIHSPTFKQI